MNIFQPPSITRYDLNFTLAGIPIRIHPLFWLLAFLFGATTKDPVYLLIWVVVVFVSILVHELGHAFVMRSYGLDAHIVLYIAGGLTTPETIPWGESWANISLSRKQEIMISLAGPLSGFLLAGIVLVSTVVAGGTVTMTAMYGIIPMPMVLLPWGGGIANMVVLTILWVNVFWGFVNLMPVYPLDGGNITRHLLIKFDPLKGLHISLWVSVIAGALVAAAGIMMSSMYIGFLFSLLAIQSYQTLQGRVGSDYY